MDAPREGAAAGEGAGREVLGREEREERCGIQAEGQWVSGSVGRVVGWGRTAMVSERGQ